MFGVILRRRALFTIISILVAIPLLLALAESLLSSEQKELLNRTHLRIWNTLDDWKARATSGWLFEPNNRKWFVVGAALVALIFFAFGILGVGDSSADWWNLLILGVAIPLGATLGWLMLRFILRRDTARSAARAILAFVILSIIALYVGYYTIITAHELTSYIAENPSLLAEYLLWHIAFDTLFTAAMFWWAAAVPIVVIWMVQLFLLISEFIFRRACEARDGVLSFWSKLFSAFRIFK